MATLRDLVDEVAATLEGYGLSQPRSAFLDSSLTSSGLTFMVTDASNLAEGVAEIGDEMVYIQSVNRETNEVTISPDGRGYRGSTAEAHDVDERVLMAPVFPRNLIRRKINETLVGLWPDLWGEGEYEFNFTPVISTYELPSEVEDVVSVSYQELQSTQEWPAIRNYKLDRHADPDTFPSGVSLTVRDGRLYGGRTVRVIFRMSPQELDELTDDFTDSGLYDSARACVVYGACERLLRGMDPSRLAVNTAEVDKYADQNPVGTAIQAAAFLRKSYEQELLDEKRRQEVRTPPTIVYTESFL